MLSSANDHKFLHMSCNQGNHSVVETEEAVSLLYPSFRNKRGSNKETISLCLFIQLASDTKLTIATKVTTLWFKQPIFFFTLNIHQDLQNKLQNFCVNKHCYLYCYCHSIGYCYCQSIVQTCLWPKFNHLPSKHIYTS